jgi:glycosyltransferase involved in cell wall biosynthesis
VLLLTETFRPEIGGGERQAALLGRGLIGRGHEVVLLTRRSRPGLAHEELDEGIRVVRVGPTGPGRRRKWGLVVSALPALWRLRRGYDVVLVSGFRILAVPALIAGRRLGKPVVLKADSNGEMSGEFFRAGLASAGLAPDSAPVRLAIRQRNRLLRRAAAFVSISDQIRDEIVGQGVPPERVHRIPNGVDTRAFRPATAEERSTLRARLGLPAGPVVVYTGRLVSYKGLPGLLEAWRDLARDLTGATLVLVGEGGGDMHDCEAALREFVRQQGLGARVRFTGAVANVEDWLRAADLFVFPTENEAFGLSLVEAMACGLPAITTAVGGIKDFVQEDRNAWVVAAGDPAGLAAAIRSLLDSPLHAARLGRAARETVLERFGEAAVAAAYERLLREVTA